MTAAKAATEARMTEQAITARELEERRTRALDELIERTEGALEAHRRGAAQAAAELEDAMKAKLRALRAEMEAFRSSQRRMPRDGPKGRTRGHVLVLEALRRDERTQAWLARRLNVSPPAVCRWFKRGWRPSAASIAAIHELLGVPVSAWEKPADATGDAR